MSENIDGIYLNAYLTESQISLGGPTPNLNGVNKDREIVYITDWEANSQLGVDDRPGDFTPAFEIEFEGTVYRRNILTWESLTAAGNLTLKYAEDGDTLGTIRSRDPDSNRGAQTGYIEGEFSYIWGDNTRGEGAFGNMVGGYNTHIKHVDSNMSVAISNYGVIDQRNQSVLLGGTNNAMTKVDIKYVVRAISNDPYITDGYPETESDYFCNNAGVITGGSGVNLLEGERVYSIEDRDYYVLNSGVMVLDSQPDIANIDSASTTSIIGGYENRIYGQNTQGSSIIGGMRNSMSDGYLHSIILGGYDNKLMWDETTTTLALLSYVGIVASQKTYATNIGLSLIASSYDTTISKTEVGEANTNYNTVISSFRTNITGKPNSMTVIGSNVTNIDNDTSESGFTDSAFNSHLVLNSDISTINGRGENQLIMNSHGGSITSVKDIGNLDRNAVILSQNGRITDANYSLIQNAEHSEINNNGVNTGNTQPLVYASITSSSSSAIKGWGASSGTIMNSRNVSIVAGDALDAQGSSLYGNIQTSSNSNIVGYAENSYMIGHIGLASLGGKTDGINSFRRDVLGGIGNTEINGAFGGILASSYVHILHGSKYSNVHHSHRATIKDYSMRSNISTSHSADIHNMSIGSGLYNVNQSSISGSTNSIIMASEFSTIRQSKFKYTVLSRLDIRPTQSELDDLGGEVLFAINSNWDSSTSTTTETIGLGTKAFNVVPVTGLSYEVGDTVTIVDNDNPSNTMTGVIDTWLDGAGGLLVNVISFTGSGTISNWTINLAGDPTSGNQIAKYIRWSLNGSIQEEWEYYTVNIGEYIRVLDELPLVNGTVNPQGLGRSYELTSTSPTTWTDSELPYNSYNGIYHSTQSNITDSAGSIIMSGAFNTINSFDIAKFNSIMSGENNLLLATGFSSILAGARNSIVASLPSESIGYSTIINGEDNLIIGTGKYQLIGGGLENNITSADAAILHGHNNKILTNVTTTQSASFATISGGIQNVIIGSPTSLIGGGRSNTITSQDNTGTTSSASSISGGIGNIIENAGYPAFIGAGQNNGIAVDPLAKDVQVDIVLNKFEIANRYAWPFDRDPVLNDKVRFTQNGQQSAPYGGIDYGVYIDGEPATADKIYYIVDIATNDVNDTFDATTVNPITEEIFPGDISNFNVGDKVFISGSTLPNFTPAYTTGFYTVDVISGSGMTLIDSDGVSRVRFTTPGTDVSAVINNVESQSIQLSTTPSGPVAPLTTPNGYNNIHMAYVESTGIYTDTGLGNIIVGGSDNYTNGVYSTIVGGSDNAMQFISYGLIVGGRENKINYGEGSSHSTIITGYGNAITSSPHAIIISGSDNSIIDTDSQSSFSALIIGGIDNRIGSAVYSHIGMGQSCAIGFTDLSDDIIDYIGSSGGSYSSTSSAYSNIISGQFNRIFSCNYGFIGAGVNNNIWGLQSTASFIGTGQNHRIVSAFSGFIGTGDDNRIGGNQVELSDCTLVNGPSYNIQIPIGGISNNSEAIISVGDYVLIGLQSGTASPDFISNASMYYYVDSVTDNVTNTDITIALHGPESTIIPVDILDPGTDAIYTIVMSNSNSYAVIVNGAGNRAYSTSAFIGNGYDNKIGVNSSYAVIDSGQENTIQRAPEAFIGNGYRNTIVNTGVATILSGENNFIGNSENDGDREGGHSTILNGDHNSIVGTGRYQLIGGGLRNYISSADAAILHGQDNIIVPSGVDADIGVYQSTFASIAGGIQNTISGAPGAHIGAGRSNLIVDYIAGVSGSVIGGGLANTIEGAGIPSFIGAGMLNGLGTEPLACNTANIGSSVVFGVSGIGQINIGTGYSYPLDRAPLVGDKIRFTENWVTDNVTEESLYYVYVDGEPATSDKIYYITFVNGGGNEFRISTSSGGADAELTMGTATALDFAFKITYISDFDIDELSYGRAGAAIISGINNNTIGTYSLIGTGENNVLHRVTFGSILNGNNNTLVGDSGGGVFSAIMTGEENEINKSSFAAIITGNLNTVKSSVVTDEYYYSSNHSAILSGLSNNIYGSASSFISSGQGHNIGKTDIPQSTIVGLNLNKELTIPTDTAFCSILGGYVNRIMYSNNSGIIAGQNNVIWGTSSSGSIIGGGDDNEIISGSYGFIGAGYNNRISGINTTATNCTLVNGPPYSIRIPFADISGGIGNEALLKVGDYVSLEIDTGTASTDIQDFFEYYVESINDTGTSTDITLAVRGPQGAIIPVTITDPGTSAIYTLTFNTNNAHAVIVNGGNNTVSSSGGFIGSGYNNIIGVSSATSAVISGSGNIIQKSSESFIGSGFGNNIIMSATAVILSGNFNFIGNDEFDASAQGSGHSTIINGDNNSITDIGRYQLIGGGTDNTINSTSPYNSIINGDDNTIEQGNHNSIMGSSSANINGASTYCSVIGSSSPITIATLDNVVVLGNPAITPATDNTVYAENIESATLKATGNIESASQIHTITQTLVDGTTVDWDMDNSSVAKLTIDGNRTINAPTNLKDGGEYVLRVIQDSVTGSRTLTWDSVFKWENGTPPTLSTGINDIDIFKFISDGTNLYIMSFSTNVS